VENEMTEMIQRYLLAKKLEINSLKNAINKMQSFSLLEVYEHDSEQTKQETHDG
jgi:hypothetical protein